MGATGVTDILSVIQDVYDSHEGYLCLEEPKFVGYEARYVNECIETGWVSSAGKYVDLFEEKLAEYCGVERAVAVVNGTAALQVALKLAGVKSGDEVILPGFTFVATGNAIAYLGAIPHFFGVEATFFGLDVSNLESYLSDILIESDGGWINRNTSRRVAAIVPMHTFGHPIAIRDLQRVAGKYELKIVEDAAESLGSTYEGEHMGTFGDISAVSFNGNKIITTGGGGAILTDDSELADKAKHLTTTARISDGNEFAHDQVGYNYRMPNINAALGVGQLEHLGDFVKRKRDVAARYRQAFSNLEGVRFIEEPPGARSNYWLSTICLEDPALCPDEIIAAATDRKIQIRKAWKPLNELGIYDEQIVADCEMVPTNRILNIPSIPIS